MATTQTSASPHGAGRAVLVGKAATDAGMVAGRPPAAGRRLLRQLATPRSSSTVAATSISCTYGALRVDWLRRAPAAYGPPTAMATCRWARRRRDRSDEPDDEQDGAGRPARVDGREELRRLLRRPQSRRP